MTETKRRNNSFTFRGDFELLRRIVSKCKQGAWAECGSCMRFTAFDKSVLSWWPSTGSILILATQETTDKFGIKLIENGRGLVVRKKVLR